jgi:hypothetical protein
VTARAVLDGIKARLAGASQGRWYVDRDEPGEVASIVVYTHSNGVAVGTYVADIVEEDGDAEFFAAAPTDVARLTGALEAVLELHEHRNGVWRDQHGQGWEGDYCLECKVEFPCDTVDNLTHALKESQ